jgi:hypothetical protein
MIRIYHVFKREGLTLRPELGGKEFVTFSNGRGENFVKIKAPRPPRQGVSPWGDFFGLLYFMNTIGSGR